MPRKPLPLVAPEAVERLIADVRAIRPGWAPAVYLHAYLPSKDRREVAAGAPLRVKQDSILAGALIAPVLESLDHADDPANTDACRDGRRAEIRLAFGGKALEMADRRNALKRDSDRRLNATPARVRAHEDCQQRGLYRRDHSDGGGTLFAVSSHGEEVAEVHATAAELEARKAEITAAMRQLLDALDPKAPRLSLVR